MEPMLQESSLVKVFSIVLVNMMYFVEFNNDHQGIAYDAKLMIFDTEGSDGKTYIPRYLQDYYYPVLYKWKYIDICSYDYNVKIISNRWGFESTSYDSSCQYTDQFVYI